MSTLPYEFQNGSAVVYNDEIHILGCNVSGYQNKHYKWDGESWTQDISVPYTFSYGCAVVYNNEIHILGGYDSSTYQHNMTYHYKYNGTAWTSVDTLPYKFYGGDAVVYNGEIHILGGTVYGLTNHYKWDGTTWTSVSTLPYDFHRGLANVISNRIHIMGGGSSDSATTLTNHYAWDGTSWIKETDLPYKCYYSASTTNENSIVLLGSYYSTPTYTAHYDITFGNINPLIIPPIGVNINGFEFIGETTSTISTNSRSITLTKSMADYEWIIFAMGSNNNQTLDDTSASLRGGSRLIKTSTIGSSLTFLIFKASSSGGSATITVTISSATKISVKADNSTSIVGFSVIGVK